MPFISSNNYYQYMIPQEHIRFGIEELNILRQGIPDILITTDARWKEASAITNKYIASTTKFGYVFATKK